MFNNKNKDMKAKRGLVGRCESKDKGERGIRKSNKRDGYDQSVLGCIY
jgi:hypothetical protein